MITAVGKQHLESFGFNPETSIDGGKTPTRGHGQGVLQ